MNILLLPLFNYKIRKLNKYDIFSKTEYTDVVRIITNKNFIKLMDSTLKIFKSESTIGIKEILSIFVITTNPGVINLTLENIDESSPEYKLYDISNKIKNVLTKIFTNTHNFNYLRFLISLFNIYIKSYHLQFNAWKKEDRICMIECLIVSYFELEEFEKDLKNSSIEELTQKNINLEKEKIIKRLESLNGLEIFENIKKERQTFMNDLEIRVKDNVYKAYWDSINNKLDMDPPEYLVLIPLLEEVLGYINKLIPNNTRLLKEAIDTFDIPYIEHKIKNNVMEPSDVRDIMLYTISIIKKLQSASDDKATNEWEDSILQSFNNEPLNKILIDFFKICFEKFENILKEATAVRNSELLNQIKEVKNI
tara:strand:- start:155 stop:1252 length:1098 start_codon:yes stop_codon:yes gene_type:complete